MLISLNLIALIAIVFLLPPTNIYLVIFTLFLFFTLLYQIFKKVLPKKSAIIFALYIFGLILLKILGVFDLLNIAILTALIVITMAFLKMK